MRKSFTVFFDYTCFSGLLRKNTSHLEDSATSLSSPINFFIKKLFVFLSGLSERGEQPLHEDKSLACH